MADWLVDFGASVSSFGVVLAFFWKLEDLASPRAKKDIANWLMRVDVPGVASHWPNHFALLFDTIFGKMHLSWRCFARSCLASVFAVGVMIVVWYRLNPDAVEIFTGIYGLSASVALITALAVILNVLPDYFSLLESRFVIDLMKDCKKAICFVSLIFLDICLTVAIFMLSLVSLVIFVNVIILGESIQHYDVNYFSKELRKLTSMENTRDEPAFGIFFYSTFFTSFWVWIYAAAVGTARFLNASANVIRLLKWFLDIEGHPIRSIGVIAGLMTAVLWSIVALARGV